ncbi:hypothetical protein [Dokdonella sp.]|uniref:hypothetical protein n=1 Tax=Dokdonella sp. TaxID=2291710 RepID=UPI003C4B7C0E
MSKAQRYFITISDLATSRGELPALSFDGVSPEHLARDLEAALREPGLWQQWRDLQDDPDQVAPETGVVDPEATVTASLEAHRVEVIISTSLPHAIVKHRLNLLVGQNWKLRDVS